MTGYQWTPASALYQLRWEPTGRRASAAEYLAGIIKAGPEPGVRAIAHTLLGMITDDGAAGEPGTAPQPDRIAELLNEYGAAKFGDEWWPGNAWAWIGREKGAELAALLEPLPNPEYREVTGLRFGPDRLDPDAQRAVRDIYREVAGNSPPEES